MTAIEQALFVGGMAHWVSAFDLSPEILMLTLHPAHRPEHSVRARFSRPRLVSKDGPYRDEREFPWDIIGFDCEQLPGGDWRFCLHTDYIEYVFDAPWPEITKAA